MRLIDVDKLKDIISDTWILDRIDEQPTVDAVEVVRCKDCKWFEPEDEDGDCWCYCDNDITCRDGYCSWGVKK